MLCTSDRKMYKEKKRLAFRIASGVRLCFSNMSSLGCYVLRIKKKRIIRCALGCYVLQIEKCIKKKKD